MDDLKLSAESKMQMKILINITKNFCEDINKLWS